MSFDRDAVELELVRVARRAQDIEWMIADQKAEIAQPYGTLKIISHEAIGTADVESLPNGNQITERVREHYVVNVSFQAIGRDSMTVLATLKTLLRRPSTIIGTKNELTLEFMRAGEVRDLAQVMSGDWEGRAQMDAVFTVGFACDLDIDTVQSVEISSAYRTQLVEVPEA